MITQQSHDMFPGLTATTRMASTWAGRVRHVVMQVLTRMEAERVATVRPDHDSSLRALIQKRSPALGLVSTEKMRQFGCKIASNPRRTYGRE